MERRVRHIEVGGHGDKVGFTLEYEDGERAHFLFARPVGRQLATKLLRALDDLDYIERQLPHDTVQVGESVSVRISPPGGGGA